MVLKLLNTTIDVRIIWCGNSTILMFFCVNVGMIPKFRGSFVVYIIQFIMILFQFFNILSLFFLQFFILITFFGIIKIRCQSFCNVLILNILLHCKVNMSNFFHTFFQFIMHTFINKISPKFVSSISNIIWTLHWGF